MSAFLRAKSSPCFGITVSWARINKDGSTSGTANCPTEETKISFRVNSNKNTRDQSVHIHKDNGRNGPELALKYTLPELIHKVFNQYASDRQKEEAFGVIQFHYFGLCLEDMALNYWNNIVKDYTDDSQKTREPSRPPSKSILKRLLATSI